MMNELLAEKKQELKEKLTKNSVLMSSHTNMHVDEDAMCIIEQKPSREGATESQQKKASQMKSRRRQKANPSTDALHRKIDQIYNMICKTKQTQEQEKEKPSILKQLTVIEQRLNYLIEIRDHLTGGLQPNDSNAIFASRKRDQIMAVFKFEKEIEREKKNMRQTLQIQKEKELLEIKKQKQEQKILQKELGASKSKEKVMKLLQRTEKPARIKKIMDPLANFTQEELDYMLYVDGIDKEQLKTTKFNQLDTSLEMLHYEPESEEEEPSLI